MQEQPPSTSPSLSLRAVVLLIAVSAPLALGVETLVRTQLFVPLLGAELEEIREFYWPELTAEVRATKLTVVAWALVGGCVLAGLLGLALMHRAGRRGLAELRVEQPGDDPRPRIRAKVRDQLLLLSSIPQIPAILATLCFTFGARLAPVLVCMVVSTAFVLAQGFVGERLLEGIEPGSRTC